MRMTFCMVLATATLALVTSCATLVAGGSPTIIIDGDTPNPVTIVTAKKTYKDVLLPVTVEVNRHKIEGQRIQVLSKTEKYRDLYLTKKTNSWAYGNILLGGLIGWGIDLITNCVAKPKDTNFYLIEKKDMPRLAAPAADTLTTSPVSEP